MNIIEVHNLSKRYGKVQALKNIDLQIEEGDMFGLVGPDGAGKSTLLRILASLSDADSGTAMVLGMDLRKEYKKIRRYVGHMPGVFSLYHDLTVEENLRFFASIFGNTIDECRELIEPIYRQIEPFRKRLAGHLSGGMKQKLALCCALIHKPKILFLDEPTTGVDAVSRKELFEMLELLNSRYHTTIVVATPYREEIECCKHIALFREGHIVKVGYPKDILGSEQTLQCNFNIDMSQPIITVRGLTKMFGSFVAVNNISFDVYRGEIFGFLGANGAGKTTAMRILSGLSYPTRGEVHVAGLDIRRDGEKIKRHIGYMSQRFSLYENLTVAENMQLFGGIYGMSRKEVNSRIAEKLKQLNFEKISDELVCRLPLGWKQKLAFVVATLHNPEIVFLDEPTGGVDVKTRKQFWQLIYQSAIQGMTVFVTTHYLDEAMYCHRICMMVDGEIKALDTPHGLLCQYGTNSMDDVFRIIAQGTVRKQD